MQIHLAWNTTSITFYNSTLEAPSWEFQYYVAGFIVHAATKCDKDSEDKWEEQAEKQQTVVARRDPRLGSLFIWQVPIKISRISLKRVEQLVPRATNLAASAEPPYPNLPPSLLHHLLLLGRTMGNNHWFMAVILVIKLEFLASKSVPAAVRW